MPLPPTPPSQAIKISFDAAISRNKNLFFESSAPVVQPSIKKICDRNKADL
jgi:hypothetical protein